MTGLLHTITKEERLIRASALEVNYPALKGGACENRLG